jgi:hypothetical protein
MADTYAGFWVVTAEATFEALNTSLLQFAAIGSRMAASKRGVEFIATDVGGEDLSYDTGSGWVDIEGSDAAAGDASKRTLGSGATQVAAGNHTH